tara:strand:+ start:557 stop:1192 length:636 start_codon:yes stop_codon:yes gene_type:complete
VAEFPLPEQYSDFDTPYKNTEWVNYESDRTALDYFDFALKDFESGDGERFKINAFSNAKRALHLQVETLANAFGFKKAFNNKTPNFHDYLKYCNKCGVITPRILKKLNKIRNAVEHDYYSPTKDEVENIIDVVELFLAATERYIFQFPVELEFLPFKFENDNLPRINAIKISANSGVLTLSLDNGGGLSVDSKEDNFFIWLKHLNFAMYRN